MTRLRVVSYIVQPVLMADDGESLVPLEVGSVNIPAIEWANASTFVAAGIEEVRQQVEGPPESEA